MRIRAVLDAVTVSTRAIVLRLEDGRVLRGFAPTVPLEQQLLGAEVVVVGVMSPSPSGDTLQLGVELIAVAKPGDGIWASPPVAEPTGLCPPEPWTDSRLDALFGRWPGDETDAQLNEAMRSSS
jgi:hypothetical protein